MARWNRKYVGAALLGLMAAFGLAAQPPKTPEARSTAAAAIAVPSEAETARAADPLGAMLADARSAYAKVRDFSCILTRQERIKDILGVVQVGEMRVRVKPASVAIRFAKPEAAAGMELRYTANTRSGKMRYRPAGAKGLNGTLSVVLDDPKVLAVNRHPVTALGIGPTLDLLASIASREKSLSNALEVFAADFTFAGKTVTRYEIFAHRAHIHRYAYRILVYVDKETKLPVRFEAYDSPKPGSLVGDLLESYSFTEVKLNVGLGDSAFE